MEGMTAKWIRRVDPTMSSRFIQGIVMAVAETETTFKETDNASKRKQGGVDRHVPGDRTG
jgi:hypothetical protein